MYGVGHCLGRCCRPNSGWSLHRLLSPGCWRLRCVRFGPGSAMPPRKVTPDQTAASAEQRQIEALHIHLGQLQRASVEAGSGQLPRNAMCSDSRYLGQCYRANFGWSLHRLLPSESWHLRYVRSHPGSAVPPSGARGRGPANCFGTTTACAGVEAGSWNVGPWYSLYEMVQQETNTDSVVSFCSRRDSLTEDAAHCGLLGPL